VSCAGFLPTGWSGNDKYVVYNNYYQISCIYNTTFTGDYTGPLTSSAPEKFNPYEEVPENSNFEGNLKDIKYLIGNEPQAALFGRISSARRKKRLTLPHNGVPATLM
jgi:hypothetical protein